MANLVPISTEGLFYIKGLVVSNSTTNPSQVVNVSFGRAALYSVVDPKVSFDTVVSGTISANSSLRGVGGLDQGTIAASKVYAVYVVASQSNEEVPAVVLSLSLKSPQMPVGKRGFVYDLYRLVGYAITDTSSNFRLANTFGDGERRKFVYDTSVRLITSLVTIVYVDIDCSALVPAIDNTPLDVYTQFMSTSVSSVLTVLSEGSPGLGNIINRTQVANILALASATIRIVTEIGVPKFAIKGSLGTSTIFLDVLGFEYLV